MKVANSVRNLKNVAELMKWKLTAAVAFSSVTGYFLVQEELRQIAGRCRRGFSACLRVSSPEPAHGEKKRCANAKNNAQAIAVK